MSSCRMNRGRVVGWAGSNQQLTGVSGGALGRKWRMRRMTRPQRRTGSNIGSLVRLCVLVSAFRLFFWSMNVTETKAASSLKRGWSARIVMCLLRVVKVMLPIVSNLVLPREGTVKYSQLRIAKKNAQPAKSTMYASKVVNSKTILVGSPLDFRTQQRIHMNRKCFMVIAFSRFSGGSRLDHARLRDARRGWRCAPS